MKVRRCEPLRSRRSNAMILRRSFVDGMSGAVVHGGGLAAHIIHGDVDCPRVVSAPH
eukprot:CAMPEP_0113525396 /NCGR_PEP_ID=MMETSP0015_2-20120614/135_1 /TAXON_ID=2838 /ORGANISM="Odontella" /LENGTH=56 /DNA_ID=CAMNT_0000423551 /DNA_START=48 /DNA_END=218 /DNA_ORIENTATION=+ /assembly_acc=CAM_ASM_000160